MIIVIRQPNLCGILDVREGAALKGSNVVSFHYIHIYHLIIAATFGHQSYSTVCLPGGVTTVDYKNTF